MSMHAYHPSLPNYDRRQIWHDGCPECESRGRTVPESIGNLDDDNLLRAVARARLWYAGDAVDLGIISQAELPLLRTIMGAVQLTRRLRFLGRTIDEVR
jgi:hypothetical protein